MRNPLSDKVIDIKPSGIRKFFDLVVEMNDPNVISLGVGEPDFDTPWHIREEGIYSLGKGRTFYTSNAGLKELKEEISAYLERKCRVEYDPGILPIASDSVNGSLSGCGFPKLIVRLPCGSPSIRSTFFPACARPIPKFAQVVVLPTPPFWLAMAMICVFMTSPHF